MRNTKSILALAFIFLFSFQLGLSQGDPDNKYRFHKVFFYSFTKYVQWPPSNTKGDFVIAVLGDSEITPLLEEMAEIKKVGNNNIVVRQVSEENLNQRMNILFVPASEQQQFDKVKTSLKDKPVLLITEGKDLARNGSMINFKDVDGKLRFEVNTANIEQAGLKVSQELVRFGEEIR
ncbi:hypothetical protein GCM10027429_05160 [Marivirga atlantica]|jgi:hypothetical protein|uniref:YfiR family protein n=1 Tax=Marivirga atlantica TaxID=1548457 RepID=A0A937A5U3_9BACT|nr:YfiR family protein [Marivirga atlantica]MBL0764125.1 YfiR family protein [Marivirga atlantica]